MLRGRQLEQVQVVSWRGFPSSKALSSTAPWTKRVRGSAARTVVKRHSGGYLDRERQFEAGNLFSEVPSTGLASHPALVLRETGTRHSRPSGKHACSQVQIASVLYPPRALESAPGPWHTPGLRRHLRKPAKSIREAHLVDRLTRHSEQLRARNHHRECLRSGDRDI